MRKIALVVLMILVSSVVFAGCSGSKTSKLEKWQEADIAREVISGVEKKLKHENVKVLSMKKIELNHYFSGVSMDKARKVHAYLGVVPIELELIEGGNPVKKKETVLFSITYGELLIDYPDPLSHTGGMIKKGTIENQKIGCDFDFSIGSKLADKKTEWIIAIRKAYGELFGDSLEERSL